ncbi:MAG: hypothetical protein F6K41_27265 [Symploca sp. SIO3E6]|nr:hypothetical protein [Caldora sp. SIO3E6]
MYPSKNTQPQGRGQLKKVEKKHWALFLLLALLSGGMSVEVEVSDSSWRVAVVKEPNSLVNLLDGFIE